jgi:PGF-CTERM protein
MDRTHGIALVFVGVVVFGVVPAAAGIHPSDGGHAEERTMRSSLQDEGTPWLAPGTGGKAVQGQEDDESQQFPGNTSFRIDNHAPGGSGNSFNIFAVGFSENIRMHWNVVRQEDFRWDTCTSTDATAFGIDRGNDDPGTETDQSLLNAYRSVTYTQDGIYVQFFKEDSLGGSPVNITVNDQIVSRVTNCLQNPDDPGWYRLTGYINGSTQMDANTDYTIYGAAKYVYICENCDSRQDAVEKLGPPPTTCPPTDEFARDSKEWTCRTRDGEYYTRSNPPSGGNQTATAMPTTTSPPGSTPADTPTPTPGATAAATPTPTPTSAMGPDTPTVTDSSTPTDPPTDAETVGDDEDDPGGTPTATPAPGTTAGPSGPDGTSTPGTGVRTPTAGSGPGFGAVVALVVLVGAALLVRRADG